MGSLILKGSPERADSLPEVTKHVSSEGHSFSPSPSSPRSPLPVTQRHREDGLAIGEAEECKVVGLAAGNVPFLVFIRQLDFFAWPHISLSVGNSFSMVSRQSQAAAECKVQLPALHCPLPAPLFEDPRGPGQSP